MKRFLAVSRVASLSALLVLSSLAGSFLPFLSNNVSAASLWDSTVINTDSLILQEAGGSTLDVTTTWLARIATSPGSLTTTERDAFQAAYLNGNYSVSLYKTTDGYGRLYVNYYSTTKNIVPCGSTPYTSCASPAASVNGFRMEDTSTISYGQIMMYYNGSDTFVQTGSHGAMVAAVFSFGSIQPFEVGFPVTYPSGYDGEQIANPTPPPNYLSPELSYSVNRNQVIIKHIGNGCIQDPDNSSSCPIPKINYGYQLGDDGDWTYQTLLVGETFSFYATEYGNYNFSAIYVDSGVPYSPLPTYYTYTATQFNIYIDGITNYSTDTTMCERNEFGHLVCEPVSPYEDCSTYGVDLIGGIGCQLRNLAVAWESMLNRLFVPLPTYFNSYFEQFGTYLNNKLGFIYSSIASVFAILGGVITGAATTSCLISPPGTLFGSPVQFNVCNLQSIIGNTAWSVMQTLVIGITIVTMVFAGIRKYQSVVSQR